MTSPSDAATTMYGVTAELVNAIPELRGLLQQAAAGGWSQDKLNALVSETPWYRQNGQQLRNLLMQQATDPATFNANLETARQKVREAAGQSGRNVDVNGVAWQFLVNNWDSNTLSVAIGQQALNTADGVLHGNAAQIAGHLKATAQAYDVPYTEGFINDYVNRIQQSGETTDGFDALMRARAKAAYPQFAMQIDAGQTITQIADPYMATMAKTLEIPQTGIAMNDPLIRKALAVTDTKTGAQVSQPLWQFEHSLKQDPRYGYTDQAKTDAYSMLDQVGKDWGFTGGGKV